MVKFYRPLCFFALTPFFPCAVGVMHEKCNLVERQKIDRAFPSGAPWIVLDSEQESTLLNRCHFATNPQASNNIFVDTKNMFVVKQNLMSFAAGRTFVHTRMDAHMKDTSYKVRPILVPDGSGFLSLHNSKASDAKTDALTLVAQRERTIIEASLYLDRPISRADQEAAEAMVLELLQQPN